MIVNRDLLQSFLQQGMPLRDVLNRGTGRTTAAVLEVITKAIRAPGTDVLMHRHEGEPFTTYVQRYNVRLIQDTIGKLGLEKMQVSIKNTGIYVRSDFAEVLS